MPFSLFREHHSAWYWEKSCTSCSIARQLCLQTSNWLRNWIATVIKLRRFSKISYRLITVSFESPELFLFSNCNLPCFQFFGKFIIKLSFSNRFANVNKGFVYILNWDFSEICGLFWSQRDINLSFNREKVKKKRNLDLASLILMRRAGAQNEFSIILKHMHFSK